VREPAFISIDAATRDYESLRARGLEIIQKLAGGVWTDYNAHDPGVTTLEQLCYVLTELSYRAQLSVEDLLARESGSIDAEAQGLFPPPAILSCNPVTQSDYRRLIADRVPEIGNVWLTPCRAGDRAGARGVYDIEVYARDLEETRFAAVRRRVRRVYVKHRSLCEDVHAIRLLRPVPAVLNAIITVDRASAPEAVLASIFYRVSNLLAPELRRQSLQSLVDGGARLPSIFAGPALDRGFVSDDQLRPRATAFTLSQIAECVAGTEAVTGVRHVALAIEGAAIEPGGQSVLSVPTGSILRLDTKPAGDRFSVRVMRGGVEHTPDAAAVARELNRLWVEHRRTHDVRADAARLLAMPAGRFVDPGSYVSVQEHYPAAYGINRFGVGAEAPPARRAQARQFKAYLLVFEQLLADSFAMLDGLRDLCTTTPGEMQRALRQYLDARTAEGTTLVPDVAPLLADSYRSKLDALRSDRRRMLERRNRFLDFALAMHGERVESRIPIPASRSAAAGSSSAAQQLRAKLRLLRHLTTAGRDRGRGSNYLSAQHQSQSSGLEWRSRLTLGMDLRPVPFARLLGEARVSLRDAPPHEKYARMRLLGSYIDEQFAPLPSRAETTPSGTDAQLDVTEELLVAADDFENYRIGSFPDDPALVVVCRAPRQPTWQLVGRYDDYDSAVAHARRVQRRTAILRQRTRRLFVIEHLLLRGTRAPRPDEMVEGFDYSLTATAVVCLPGREADDKTYRDYVRGVIRRLTPAHIVVHTSFLRLRHVAEFERLHAEWRRQLASGGDRNALENACRALREFLLPAQS
jgi:hypothetical protein